MSPARTHRPSFATVMLGEVHNHAESSGGEFRMLRDALDSPQVGVTFIRLPTGADTQGDQGHYHDAQDEIYVLVSGGPIEAKLDDRRITLNRREALLVRPGTVRAFRNRGEEAIMIAASGARPPEGDDSHPVDGFWPRADT